MANKSQRSSKSPSSDSVGSNDGGARKSGPKTRSSTRLCEPKQAGSNDQTTIDISSLSSSAAAAVGLSASPSPVASPRAHLTQTSHHRRSEKTLNNPPLPAPVPVASASTITPLSSTSSEFQLRNPVASSTPLLGPSNLRPPLPAPVPVASASTITPLSSTSSEFQLRNPVASSTPLPGPSSGALQQSRSRNQLIEIDRASLSGGLKFYIITHGHNVHKVVDGQRMVRDSRLSVLKYLMDLKKSTGSRGAAARTFNTLINNVDYLCRDVLRKQPNDPHFEPASEQVGIRQKLELPTGTRPFPGCPGTTKQENEIEKVLHDSLINQLKFHVSFKNYHGSYWLHYLTVGGLNLSPVRQYLFALARKSYPRYDKIVKVDLNFTSQTLDVSYDGSVDIDSCVREAVAGPPSSILITPTNDNPLGPFNYQRNRVEAILDRAFPAKHLAFLVKFQSSYRLYWLDGRITAKLGRHVMLEHILRVRLILGETAWAKILSDGRYIFSDVLRRRPGDPEEILSCPGHRGKSSALKQPSSDNLFPGCPGQTRDDNDIQSILEHSFAKQLSFYVVFRNYHGYYWLHHKTLMSLDYRAALRDYWQNLPLVERAKIGKLNSALVAYLTST